MIVPEVCKLEKSDDAEVLLQSKWRLKRIRRAMFCYKLMDEPVSANSLCYVPINEYFFYKRIHFQGR